MFHNLDDRERGPPWLLIWRLERREGDEDKLNCQWIWESTAPTSYRRSFRILGSPSIPCPEPFTKTKIHTDLSRNTTLEKELLSDHNRRRVTVRQFIPVQARHHQDLIMRQVLQNSSQMLVECHGAARQQGLFLPHVKTLFLRRIPALSILLLPTVHCLHLLTRLSFRRFTSQNQLFKLEYRERVFQQILAPVKVWLRPQLTMLIHASLMLANDGAGLRASNNYLGAFINTRDLSPTPPSPPSKAPERELPTPSPNRKSPPPAINTLPSNPRPVRKESIPVVQQPETFMDDESEYGDGFKVTPPSPG